MMQQIFSPDSGLFRVEVCCNGYIKIKQTCFMQVVCDTNDLQGEKNIRNFHQGLINKSKTHKLNKEEKKGQIMSEQRKN